MGFKDSKYIWKPIPGFEGIYEINEFGVCYNILNTKILPGSKHGNYRATSLTKNGINSVLLTHRLVAMAFHHNSENKPCVNHKDGIKTNNHYTNLEWCTYSENNIHAFRTGLKDPKKMKYYYGNNHHMSLIPDEKLHRIFELRQEGVFNQREIATIFQVSTSCINNILSGKSRSKQNVA